MCWTSFNNNGRMIRKVTYIENKFIKQNKSHYMISFNPNSNFFEEYLCKYVSSFENSS